MQFDNGKLAPTAQPGIIPPTFHGRYRMAATGTAARTANINPNRLGNLWGPSPEPTESRKHFPPDESTKTQAIDRRRRSRAERRAARERRRTGDEREIELKRLAVVEVMIQRRTAFKLEIHPVHNSYLYWSLRRVGHNVIFDHYRTEFWADGFWIVPSEHCRAFRWWCELHPTQRDCVLADKRHSVETVPLKNPKVVIEKRHDDGSQWGRLDPVVLGARQKRLKKHHKSN